MKYTIFAASAALFAAPLSGAIAQDNPFAANAPANPFATAQVDRYVGVFQSDAVRLTLVKAGDGFTGELYYLATDATYPLTAKVEGDALKGTFVAGGANFPFTFTLTADRTSGAFDTEGYSGTLAPQSGGSNLAKSIKPGGQAEELLDEALEISKTLPADKKGSALYSIIGLKAALGDIDGARELLKLIPGSDIFRNYAIQGIAKGQLVHGDLDGAIATANMISNPALRLAFDGEIITHHIKQGDIATGLTLARSKTSPSDRATTLLSAATALHFAGDANQAKLIMEEAKASALSIGDENLQNSAFFSVIYTYIALGDEDAALELVRQRPFDLMAAMLYASVANAKVEKGDHAGARAITETAISKVAKMKPKMFRSSSYLQLVSVYVHLNDSAGKQKIINLAAKTTLALRRS